MFCAVICTEWIITSLASGAPLSLTAAVMFSARDRKKLGLLTGNEVIGELVSFPF
jgi:hypothetical protein